MPQPIFHLYLAERPAIQYAVGELNPEARNAFLHGALAPDAGFFPGGDARLSLLVHHSRTADMCRALLRLAERLEQRAFAFGWLTHVLADALMHPVINSWCRAELGAQVEPADLTRLHIQLELGIDVLHVAAVHRQGVPRFRSMLTDASVGFLQQAYQQTYGLKPSPAALIFAHRNVERLSRQLLELEVVLAGASRDSMAGMPHKLLLRALRTVAAVSNGPRSLVTAFLAPVFPNLDLALVLKQRLDVFDRWFVDCVADDLQMLPNLDLDTGQPIAAEVDPAA